MIELPARIDEFGDHEPVTNGSDIWWVTESHDAMVRVNVADHTAYLLDIVVHTVAHRTSPAPPPGLDISDHTASVLSAVQAELVLRLSSPRRVHREMNQV